MQAPNEWAWRLGLVPLTFLSPQKSPRFFHDVKSPCVKYTISISLKSPDASKNCMQKMRYMASNRKTFKLELL